MMIGNLPLPTGYFSNLEEEHHFEAVEVSGTLPHYLYNGTLYRNGVGQFEQFQKPYKHAFEGDGAITALRFVQGKAYASSQLVQSTGLLAERKAGKHLGGSAAPWITRLGANFKGNYKNTANTNIVDIGGRLFALMEGGKPTEIGAENLSTQGEFDFNGLISGTFSAHPHYNQARQTLYNFGLTYGKDSEVTLFAFSDKGSPEKLGSFPIAKPVMVHDFIVTANHLIFFICPAQFSLWKLLLAVGKSFVDCLNWNASEGTEVVVIPIDQPTQIKRFKSSAFFTTHFGGAYEEDGKIIVDYIFYENIDVLHDLGNGSHLTWDNQQDHSHGTLYRAIIDTETQQFKAQKRRDYCEFPRVLPTESGLKYDSLWMQTEKYIDGVLRSGTCRLDSADRATEFFAEPGQLCSEPVPVEDSVLVLVYDCRSNTSHILVLESTSLEEQARIQLPWAVPLTFHGNWVSSTK